MELIKSRYFFCNFKLQEFFNFITCFNFMLDLERLSKRGVRWRVISALYIARISANYKNSQNIETSVIRIS